MAKPSVRTNDDILFASLNLPSMDLGMAIDQIQQVDSRFWFWDTFRATWMLPLMTATGGHSVASVENMYVPSGSGFNWTSFAPIEIRNYMETHIFPWMGLRPRIMILKTPGRAANNEHIDCRRGEFSSVQHKFRYVLQGRADSLFFLTHNDRIAVPDTKRPFIMDGRWPHGMVNNCDVEKITLCAGAPWSGSKNYPEFVETLWRTDYVLPENLERFVIPE